MKKMTRVDRERLFREVLASILASKLRLPELRHLADVLDGDRRFAHELARAIWSIADSSITDEYQDQLFISEEDIAEEASSGLVDLAYKVIQRRRMPKAKLVGTLKSIAPNVRWPGSAVDMPVRDIISRFFEVASTSQAQAFLDRIGMEVAQDPFLGGISERGKK